MNPTLTIQFEKSNSKLFEKVVKMAVKFEGYSFENNVHVISFSRESLMLKWEKFYEIYGLSCNWKSFSLLLNNVEIPRDKVNRVVNEIKEVSRCFNNFLIYKSKDIYCNESPFGCLNIKSINLNPETYGNYWYLYGHFEDGYSKWIIHKKEIKAIIQEEIARKQLRFCPVFTTGKIEEAINSFPDFIDLKNGNENWRVVSEKRFQGSKIIDVPVSIEHFIKEEEEPETEITPGKDVRDWFALEMDGEEANPFEKDTDEWTNWEIDNFLNSGASKNS